MRAHASIVCLLALTATAARQSPQQSSRRPTPPFFVHVVDAATGRGVPLVELRTVHEVTFVTDSHGIAAIDEPELAGIEVFFHVKSHGYTFPADGFGNRGVRAKVTPGGSRTIELQRVNLAERLYRVTGAGIYRDSVLVGRDVPLARPLLSGGVFGQDSVVNAVYRGRLYWFWGDTNRASYPLGNFSTSGATSRLPADGGLDPALGVDLDYFTGEGGFARAMCAIDGPGPVWIDGLFVLDEDGREVMLCHYARMKDLGHKHEHGIARWSDELQRFEKLGQLPLDLTVHPLGHATTIELDGEPWLCFCHPFPLVRVRPRLADVLDPDRYEAFTCLSSGARFDAREPSLDRGDDGKLVWGWKAHSDAVTPRQWGKMVGDGQVEADEAPYALRDVQTGDGVDAHGGTIAWNAYRQKWIAIVLQVFGRSMLGEVWYAEADQALGPWRDARRIVTHDDYSFYNVAHHPYFDQDGGRFVYFEGTYTRTFSGNPVATPRYDYNQIMYRLDLADERLHAARAREGR